MVMSVLSVSLILKESVFKRFVTEKNSTFQFKLLSNSVYVEPDEVGQPIKEVDQNLTITKELYSTIVP